MTVSSHQELLRGAGNQDAKHLLSTEELEGSPVFDEEGMKIGDIHHILIGRTSGKAECAVLSFGSILGLGGRHFPVPWSAIEPDRVRGGFIAHLPNDRLHSAPSHLPGQEPMYGTAYTSDVFAYYGLAWPALFVPQPSLDPRSDLADRVSADAEADCSGAELISTDKIKGMPVYRADHEERLGELKGVIIDAASGEARQAMVAHDGRFDFPERTETLPWDALRYEPDVGNFVMSASPASVER